jgi:hypothetical protein
MTNPTDTSDDADEESVAEAVAGYEPGDAFQARWNNNNPYAPDIEAEEQSLSLADAMGGGDGNPDPNAGDRRNDGPSAVRSVQLPESALPTGQLRALTHTERRQAALNVGRDWPTTEEARDELEQTVFNVIRNKDEHIVNAPTSLGKTHTVAATRWGARDDIAGDKPVVQLLPTRDARDEAAAVAEEEGGSYIKLRGRHEACPVCAGDYDPEPDDEDDGLTITIEGMPASDWMGMMCNDRGVPFSDAHRYLNQHNDQNVPLPCSANSTCPAVKQYDDLREEENPLVIATHNFAHVPGLRMGTNVVIDEEPNYELNMSTDRLKEAITAFLDEANAHVDTWEDLWSVATADNHERRLGEIVSGDEDLDVAARKKGLVASEYCDSVWNELRNQLYHEPDRDWYYDEPNAHTMAGPLARAVLNSEEQAGGRRKGKTFYEPIRPDAHLRDDDGWNREWLSIVFDSKNEVSFIRSVPDFSQTRSFVGLDAHPSVEVWSVNTIPDIGVKKVLSDEKRHLWRQYERGLRVVQVGEATRPLASGNYFNGAKTRTLVEHLRDEYGSDFKSAITSKAVGEDLEDIMSDVGAYEPQVMTYGEEKSRNDFSEHEVGYVHGCIDPGDDMVMDIVAELELDAVPVRANVCCEHCGDRDDAPEEAGSGCHRCNHTGWAREKGREFEGEDADAAASILASVRENHVAQAAGRYARNPDDPEASATVYVATDAIPDGFADVKVPGVIQTFTKQQREIVRTLRESERPMTAKDIANNADCTARYVRDVLGTLTDWGYVDTDPMAGPNGATLYADTGVTEHGHADVAEEVPRTAENSMAVFFRDSAERSRTNPFHSTWSFRCASPSTPFEDENDDDTDEPANADENIAVRGGGRPPGST